MNYKVLAMNFGYTSTKVAIYEGDKEVMIQTFRHTNEEMANIHNMEENAAFRKGVIMNYLQEQGVNLTELDAIVGRGGLMRGIEGGTYIVNDNMLKDLHSCQYGYHVCNLGGILASEIRGELGRRVAKQLRIVPEIAFYLDSSIDYAEHIDELLKK